MNKLKKMDFIINENIPKDIQKEIKQFISNPTLDLMMQLNESISRCQTNILKNANSSKKTTLLDKLKTTQANMYLLGTELTGNDSYYSKVIFDDQFRNLEIEKEKKELLKLSKNELVDKLAKANISLSLYSLLTRSNMKKIISSHFLILESENKKIKNSTSKEIGRKQTYANNNKCLKECLEELKVNLNRELIASDYSGFKRIVERIYPIPPFKQKARLSKQYKSLSKNQQDEEREYLHRDGWAESTLRKFYEENTGVKPTSLKK